MIPTSGTGRKAQEKSPFPAGKPRKSMENESSNPVRNWIGRHKKNPKNFRSGIMLP